MFGKWELSVGDSPAQEAQEVVLFGDEPQCATPVPRIESTIYIYIHRYRIHYSSQNSNIRFVRYSAHALICRTEPGNKRAPYCRSSGLKIQMNPSKIQSQVK